MKRIRITVFSCCFFLYIAPHLVRHSERQPYKSCWPKKHDRSTLILEFQRSVVNLAKFRNPLVDISKFDPGLSKT